MKPLRVLIFLFLALAGCARQGSIPNTDKFPPHLLSVTSNYNNQLSLKFDDILDGEVLLPSTFSVVSDNDTARIRYIALDNDDRYCVLLLTSTLRNEPYILSGLVVDRHGNAATIKKTFRPSTRPDTIQPSILLSPLNENASFPYKISAQFNEPPDTSRKLKVVTAPYVSADKLVVEWDPDLMEYNLTCSDSSVADKAFYFVVLPGVYDFAGNGSDYGLATYVFKDTSLVFHDALGSIRSSADKLGVAVILFKRADYIYAATVSDSTGGFTTSLTYRDSVTVEAWVDVDGNGTFEETSSRFFAQLPKRIEIVTTPQIPPRWFDGLVPAEK